MEASAEVQAAIFLGSGHSVTAGIKTQRQALGKRVLLTQQEQGENETVTNQNK